MKNILLLLFCFLILISSYAGAEEIFETSKIDCNAENTISEVALCSFKSNFYNMQENLKSYERNTPNH